MILNVNNSEIHVKFLDEIEPFNDIFFNNCFYNPFFTMINHFKRNIYYFLANNIISYHYHVEEAGIVFNIESLINKNSRELLEDLGIYSSTKDIKNIIDNIKKSLLENKPIILSIDTYYNSKFRKFSEFHAPHPILIYGFNDIEKVFNIVDAKWNNSYLYEKQKISYNDVIEGYKGYIENFNSMGMNYFEYYAEDISNNEKINNNDFNICKSIWIDNMRINKNFIYYGIEKILLLVNDFKNIENKITANEEVRFPLIFRDIWGNKLATKYIINIFLHTNNLEILNLLDQLITDWNVVLALRIKSDLNKSISLKNCESCIKRLLNIYNIEYKLNDKLFKLL